jgi:hypothetical protein
MLDQLRADFPGYVIDTEAVPSGKRYVAVRRGPGPGPHTVITPDPDELRSALHRGTGARRLGLGDGGAVVE